MDYRKFGNTLIVRIDKGEEILEQVMEIASREHITLASVQALGAIGQFTAGVFRTEEKQYQANEFSTMDGKPYCHLHISAGDEKGQVFGGHLNRAVVSATCEMVIQIIDGQVERRFDEEIGLNLFHFL